MSKARTYKPKLGKPKTAHVAGARRPARKPVKRKIVYRTPPRGFVI